MEPLSLFIRNLHCPSCIPSLESALARLSIGPNAISVSVPEQSVRLLSPDSVSPSQVHAVLSDAGFEVECESGDYGISSSSPSLLHSAIQVRKRKRRHLQTCEACKSLQRSKSKGFPIRSWTRKSHGLPAEEISLHESPLSRTDSDGYYISLSIGGMTCASCVNAVMDALNGKHGVSELHVDLLGKSGSAIIANQEIGEDIKSTIEDIGYECEIVSIKPLSKMHNDVTQSFKAVLRITGMTCTNCESTISRTLKLLDCVESADVSFLSRSANVVFTARENIAKIKVAVEESGYECEITNVLPVAQVSPRTIILKVDGMSSGIYAEDVRQAIKSLDSEITIETKPNFSLAHPEMRLTYTPTFPSLTIHTIISAITSVNESLKVSTVQQPTVEERAEMMAHSEQKSLLRRLIAAFIFSIPTFIFGIVIASLLPSSSSVRQYFEQSMWAGTVPRTAWILFILATPVWLFIADIFHRKAVVELFSLWRPGSRTPVYQRFIKFGSMNLLMSLGTSIAYFASIVLLILNARSSTANSTTYFDSVVFLTFFVIAGRYIEAFSRHKTAGAITELKKLRPKEALLLDENGRTERISAELLEVGDRVLVTTGSSPPTDGIIISGFTTLDESSLTGEAKPISKGIGEQVFEGTINRERVVTMCVSSVRGQSLLDQIVDVIRQAQSRKPPIAKIADTVTGYFVPTITYIALITWMLWLGLGEGGVLPSSYLDQQIGGWPIWSLQFAIAVFVIACPCGLALAAPTACFVGSGLCAKYGILANGGGEAFQMASKVSCVVFDKTGTLTKGISPEITDFEIFLEDGMDSLIWTLASELEKGSSHPLAVALTAASQSHEILSAVTTEHEEIPGRGVKGIVRITATSVRCQVIIGNEMWMQENQVEVPSSVQAKLETWKRQAKSVILLATTDADQTVINGRLTVAAIFAASDPIRPDAIPVIEALQKRNIDVWMISGDNQTTAVAVARLVGIPERCVIAGVLPQEKAMKVSWLQESPEAVEILLPGKNESKRPNRRIVAMVGDGINDAPALSTADVGIAMGSGSDIAIGSANFILMSSNLVPILTLLDLSGKVIRRIKFNFLWAVVYNLIGVPIAAGVLYPPSHYRLNPVWASLAMALSSISVVSSSLALKLYNPPTTVRNWTKANGFNGQPHNMS